MDEIGRGSGLIKPDKGTLDEREQIGPEALNIVSV